MGNDKVIETLKLNKEGILVHRFTWPKVFQRDDNAKLQDRFLTVPNLVTISSMICLVPLGFALFNHSWWWAGFLLAWVIFSDTLDGNLARWLNQQSKFGAVLDPIRDSLARYLLMIWLMVYFKDDKFLILILSVAAVEVTIGAINLIVAQQVKIIHLDNSWAKFRCVVHFLVGGIIFFHCARVWYLSENFISSLFLLQLITSLLALWEYAGQGGRLLERHRKV